MLFGVSWAIWRSASKACCENAKRDSTDVLNRRLRAEKFKKKPNYYLGTLIEADFLCCENHRFAQDKAQVEVGENVSKAVILGTLQIFSWF